MISLEQRQRWHQLTIAFTFQKFVIPLAQGRVLILALIALRRGDIGIPREWARSELAARCSAEWCRRRYRLSLQVLLALLLLVRLGSARSMVDFAVITTASNGCVFHSGWTSQDAVAKTVLLNAFCAARKFTH